MEPPLDNSIGQKHKKLAGALLSQGFREISNGAGRIPQEHESQEGQASHGTFETTTFSRAMYCSNKAALQAAYNYRDAWLESGVEPMLPRKTSWPHRPRSSTRIKVLKKLRRHRQPL